LKKRKRLNKYILMKINVRNLKSKSKYNYKDKIVILRILIIKIALKTGMSYYTYYTDIQALSLEDITILKHSAYETFTS